VLYSFKGGSDGAFPSDLIANHRGALFGAAARGGNSACGGFGCGTVFELTLCEKDQDHDHDKCPG